MHGLSRQPRVLCGNGQGQQRLQGVRESAFFRAGSAQAPEIHTGVPSNRSRPLAAADATCAVPGRLSRCRWRYLRLPAPAPSPPASTRALRHQPALPTHAPAGDPSPSETPVSTPHEPFAPNRLATLPEPPRRPNQVWAADLTYLPTREQDWCYLAVELDQCSASMRQGYH